MNVWRLTAANNLVMQDEPSRQEEGKRRVRVTKVLVNSGDARLFRGEKKVKYPFIPGRYAVGILADDLGSQMLPKGTRVLLHSYLPAENGGSDPATFEEEEYRVMGRTENGFLRDFVYMREEDLTPIPDSVNDQKSLLIQHVALAQEAVETLDAKRGEHIAVIGGNILGLLVCRLLIYRQAAPILIDTRQDRLAFARSRGVYYTSLADENLMSMLGTVTGGRLADGAVFVMGAEGNDVSLPVKVCASGKHVAFCGRGEGYTANLRDIVRKQLTLHGVADGSEHLEAALNLVANGAIDLNVFRYNIFPAAKAASLLQELSAVPDRPVDEINVLNLV